MFVLLPSKTDKTRSLWAETKNKNDFRNAIAGATVWSRAGKTVLADCFYKGTPNRQPNTVRFYFHPTGAIAKDSMTLRAFDSPSNANGKLIVTKGGTYYDASGEWLMLSNFTTSSDDSGDFQFHDAKTYKKKPVITFSASVKFFDPRFINAVKNLPFYDLLNASRPQR
jgi:hypothetical protein